MDWRERVAAFFSLFWRLLEEGIGRTDGRTDALPASHLETGISITKTTDCPTRHSHSGGTEREGGRATDGFRRDGLVWESFFAFRFRVRSDASRAFISPLTSDRVFPWPFTV